MTMIAKLAGLFATVLPLSSNACVQQPSAADQVADQFLADNRQPAPNDPKRAKDVEFLDNCSATRIRASDISYSDTQAAITAKVHDAMQKCIDELNSRNGKESGPAPVFRPVP